MKTITQKRIALAAAISELDALITAGYGIRESADTMRNEQNNLAAQIDALMTGDGEAAALGLKAASLDHSRQILQTRIEASEERLRQNKILADASANRVRRCTVEALDEWVATIVVARGAVLRKLVDVWLPTADWTVALSHFLNDSKIFLPVGAIKQSFHDLPIKDDRNNGWMRDYAQEALALTDALPEDVSAPEPATTAPAAKRAA